MRSYLAASEAGLPVLTLTRSASDQHDIAAVEIQDLDAIAASCQHAAQDVGVARQAVASHSQLAVQGGEDTVVAITSLSFLLVEPIIRPWLPNGICFFDFQEDCLFITSGSPIQASV